MRRFARLYRELDSTTSTRNKLSAMTRYLSQAPAADAAWAVYFLAGGKPRQLVPKRLMSETVLHISGLPAWLFEECRLQAGDFAETVADVLPDPLQTDDTGLAAWMEQRLIPLRNKAPAEAEALLGGYWMSLDWEGRFLLTKLVGGAFRVGVSRLLVQRALAEHSGIDPKTIAQRMMGYIDGKAAPTAERYLGLVDSADAHRGRGQPYPFFLAHALTAPAETLGYVSDWLAEWKYDGIRAQIVRHDDVAVWSRGEELVTERFPEAEAVGTALGPGTVLDGELLTWKNNAPAPFALLQQRIGRKKLTPKILESAPVAFLAYDLLEQDGHDIRSLPQSERRGRLETLIADLKARNPELPVSLSPRVEVGSWEELRKLRMESRARGVEGLMLKRWDAGYGVGRTKDVGTWWKWKIDPYSIDAVLVYAQHGSGRRAGLYTDYTFAVWRQTDAADDGKDLDLEGTVAAQRQLIPFAKAYSGLTDAEIAEVDSVIRRTTIEKFGPVRSLTPTLVFELGFEGIQASSRHKSGVAVRFPRILRWRRDKSVEEANTLSDLKALMNAMPGT